MVVINFHLLNAGNAHTRPGNRRRRRRHICFWRDFFSRTQATVVDYRDEQILCLCFFYVSTWWEVSIVRSSSRSFPATLTHEFTCQSEIFCLIGDFRSLLIQLGNISESTMSFSQRCVPPLFFPFIFSRDVISATAAASRSARIRRGWNLNRRPYAGSFTTRGLVLRTGRSTQRSIVLWICT